MKSNHHYAFQIQQVPFVPWLPGSRGQRHQGSHLLQGAHRVLTRVQDHARQGAADAREEGQSAGEEEDQREDDR